MSARIIDRGRGPEIEGTRITVYAVMDYVREGDPAEVIAQSLRLTPEQVQVALGYIQAHQDEVNRVYEQLLDRDRQGNPAWVDALRARTREELEERIRQRRVEDVAHAGRGRQ
jgi:uncharacterized protein (DUF433 family)